MLEESRLTLPPQQMYNGLTNKTEVPGNGWKTVLLALGDKVAK